METTEKNMEHGEHFNESIVNEVILEDMKKNRIDHMKYLPGMETMEESDVMEQVIAAMNAYDYDQYTEKDVRRALEHDNRTIEDFQALLSPAALPQFFCVPPGKRLCRPDSRSHIRCGCRFLPVVS